MNKLSMPTHASFLSEQLLLEHSKPQALRLANWIGNDSDRLAALVGLVLGSDQRLCQRAAWALSVVADKRPYLLDPWLPQLVARIRELSVHDAVKRSVVRLLQDRDIPDSILDALADACFGFLTDPKEAAAIRIFSMSVLENICKKVPELKPELRLLLEEHMPHGTAGFKSRGRKILKRL